MSETLTKQPDSEAAAVGLSRQLDVLDQLMKPEVQKSLTELIDQLPKLNEMVTMMTKVYDVAQTVANDRVLIDDMVGGFTEIFHPVQDKVKGIASAAIEANERSQNDTTTIGMFGLLKMMKDPQVQKLFRFAQAFLDVMSERQKQS